MPVCMADVTRILAQIEQGDTSTSLFAMINQPLKTQEGTKTGESFPVFSCFLWLSSYPTPTIVGSSTLGIQRPTAVESRIKTDTLDLAPAFSRETLL
jgi:hypothetical protein